MDTISHVWEKCGYHSDIETGLNISQFLQVIYWYHASFSSSMKGDGNTQLPDFEETIR